jgi:hypothetical protein
MAIDPELSSPSVKTMVQVMSSDPLIPRGNPLTEGMDLTTHDGVRWTAYVDGYSPKRPRRLLPQTVLPGRRLRFDSASESRISPELPAGSPFLGERRLLGLLAASPLLPEPEQPPPSLALLRRQRWQARIAAGRARCVRRGRAFVSTARLVVEALQEGHWARS